MKKSLMVLLGGLMLSVLISGTVMAASDRPLHPGPIGTGLSPAGPSAQTGKSTCASGYTLNEALVGRSVAAVDPSGEPVPVELDLESDMAEVRFRNRSSLTPYLGAGLTPGSDSDQPSVLPPDAEQDEKVDLTGSYRVAAGFDCLLDKTTRLNLGYRYTPGAATEPSRPVTEDRGPREEDDHNISLGLEMNF